MHQTWTRNAAAGLALVALAACGRTDSNTNTPLSPSNTTTSLVLGGTWSGTLGSPGDPDPDHFTWTAAQNGTSVTGSVVFTMTGSPPKVVNGTMTGAADGTQVTLTFKLAAGVFSPWGAPADCAMSGTLTSSPTTTSIIGTMTRTFSASCVGTAAKTVVDSVQLSLTKQ